MSIFDGDQRRKEHFSSNINHHYTAICAPHSICHEASTRTVTTKYLAMQKVPLVLMTMKDADIISTSMLVVAFLDLVVNVHFWIVDTTEKLRRAGSRPSARSAGWRTYLPLRSRHGRRG
ncbi:hypothetical protein G6O67_008106 [Ophiocordyceps sinensis]|uniref:Uncharacterized protein n=1 Tax=Ophiocordyceps sinensis TaxID=72228 RepID=A0A8H4PNA6_9HYPO|nr:hypothetical protein G6O67_008106 [Ophiocordyceps sinensis]